MGNCVGFGRLAVVFLVFFLVFVFLLLFCFLALLRKLTTVLFTISPPLFRAIQRGPKFPHQIPFGLIRRLHFVFNDVFYYCFEYGKQPAVSDRSDFRPFTGATTFPSVFGGPTAPPTLCQRCGHDPRILQSYSYYIIHPLIIHVLPTIHSLTI